MGPSAPRTAEKSIQFGEGDRRERAEQRLARLTEAGQTEARPTETDPDTAWTGLVPCFLTPRRAEV